MRLHRKERVGELLRDELAKIVLREVELPGGLITVTAVEVSDDLQHAKVKVSVLPGDKSKAVLNELKRKVAYFQHLLLKTLSIKPIPRIFFDIDRGPERAAIIEKDLIEVEKTEKEIQKAR